MMIKRGAEMKMTKPEIKFIKFNTKDIITTSGEASADDPSRNALNDEPAVIQTDETVKSLTKDFHNLSWNNYKQ